MSPRSPKLRGVFAFAFCSLSAVADVRYRATTLADLPGGYYRSTASDINDAGQMCGISFVPSNHACIWTQPETVIDLNGLVPCPEGVSIAEAINDAGTIVGVSYSGPNCVDNEAIVWTPESEVLRLGDLPGAVFYSYGYGINNLGQATGISVSNADAGRLTQEAFLWDISLGMVGLADLPGGQFISVAYDINDSIWITGWSCSSNGCEAFVWTPEDGMLGIGDLIPGPSASSTGYAINNLGQIAGIAGALPYEEAFLWDPVEGMIGLGRLWPDDDWNVSSANAVNDLGQVVGVATCCFLNFSNSAFLWDRQHGMRDLNTLIDPCQSLGIVRNALGINNRGQIVADMDSDPGAILLTPYLPGDLDEDEDVDLQDLAALLSNFGRSGDAAYEHGDLDCDQSVTVADLSQLLANFGQTLP